MSRETIELAAKLVKLSNQEIGRLGAGSYGSYRQSTFFRDLNKVLEAVAGTARPFHAA